MPVEVKQTWDDQRLKRERLASLQTQMKQLGIGAMYLHDGVNVRYVLNVPVPGGAVFVPAEGDAIAIIRPRDVGYVKLKHPTVIEGKYTPADTWAKESTGRVNQFTQMISDLMAQHGVAGEPLAVDPLDVSAYTTLNAAGIRLANALQAIERARSVKTQDEVEIYRRIGDQYAYTVKAFRDALRPGVTESELAALVVTAWGEAGGEDIAQLNVCAGENMNPWRRWPTQRPLQEGEFVGIDLHGRGFNGLRGDASRTFFVGDNPTPEERDLYRRAYDYLFATIDTMRGGRSFAEVLSLVPRVPEQYRSHLYNYNIAHGVGLQYSGYPQVDMTRQPLDDTLKPNQVLSIESYFGEVGSPLAVKLEENIVVREGAPELLAPNMPFDERFIA
jgi:Xaa-Pro aminopeptidase